MNLVKQDIRQKLDQLERVLMDVLEFSIPVGSADLTSIAVGPDKAAGAANTTNVVAIENARRAVDNMRELWGL